MLSGILTVMQMVCASVHGGSLSASSTGASIGIVEPKFGPESTTAASGVPQLAPSRPETRSSDQRSDDFIPFASADQNLYCSPKSTVARLTGMSSTLLGSAPPLLAA